MIPWVREWYETYRGDDFALISVHYPEFANERVVENVQAAAERLGVAYPIAIDNAGVTWRAYRQRFWPTRYLLDKSGHIRFVHYGEGAYEETAQVIEYLMAQPDPPAPLSLPLH